MKLLNQVDMLAHADNMPGKWQFLIFLGQQTILNLQAEGSSLRKKNIWLLILESTEKEKREGTVDKSFSKKVKFLCFSYIDQLHG